MDTTDKHTPQSVTRDEPRDFMESMLYWHERAMTSEKELSNVRTIKNEIAETAKEYMDANDSLQKELSEARGRIERLEAGLSDARNAVKARIDDYKNQQEGEEGTIFENIYRDELQELHFVLALFPPPLPEPPKI